MKLSKCDNGHFFDSDKYPECPYCNTALLKDSGSGIVVPAHAAGDAGAPGVPLAPATPEGPVTGWLVVLNGIKGGCDYRLGEGRSFFGLDPANENAPTPLSPDAPLSARLLIIAYDPATAEFTALPGAGQALVYLNGKAILTPQLLKSNDELNLGDARLRFIAFCGNFRWPKAVRQNKKLAPKPAPEKPSEKENERPAPVTDGSAAVGAQ